MSRKDYGYGVTPEDLIKSAKEEKRIAEIAIRREQEAEILKYDAWRSFAAHKLKRYYRKRYGFKKFAVYNVQGGDGFHFYLCHDKCIPIRAVPKVKRTDANIEVWDLSYMAENFLSGGVRLLEPNMFSVPGATQQFNDLGKALLAARSIYEQGYRAIFRNGRMETYVPEIVPAIYKEE